jgi:hypothetical protein
MLHGASRRLGHRIRQSRRPTFWNDHSVDAGSVSGPENGPQVPGVFYTIKDKKKRRLSLLDRDLQNIIKGRVLLCRSKGDHPLMVHAGRFPVQGLTFHEPHLCTILPRKAEDHLYIPVLFPLFGHQDTLNRPAGFERLQDWFYADDLFFGHGFQKKRTRMTRTLRITRIKGIHS